MSFATVWSAQSLSLKTNLIRVEVDTQKGFSAFSVVGLPDKAVEEARDRVCAAIKNTGFKSPKQKNQKVIISLAPADLKKEGTLFDLPMALSYLLASKYFPADTEKKLFLGELSLDGEVRPVTGVLPVAEEAKRRGFKELYVPEQNAAEAALIEGITVYAVKNLRSLVAHLSRRDILADEETPFLPRKTIPFTPQTPYEYHQPETLLDFSDVKGQQSAKRGLEIAAAGGHNIAMWGPPGTGKTMLAKALTGILPPLDLSEALEVTGIHSVAGALREPLITHPPFRSPHHTASHISIVGGGAIPRPGEITLAHRGVLFLDEFPEFDRRVIESLREPLEERVVSVSRARGSAQFPARVIFVAALNPCPCGNRGVAGKRCECPQIAIERYQRRLSGPIVDRIDMWVEVSRVEHEKLLEKGGGEETSAAIRERVIKARQAQAERFKTLALPFKTNSEISAKEILRVIPLDEKTKKTLTAWAKKHDLSARAAHRIIKLARTIADLEGHDEVATDDVMEALQYRPKQLQN